MQRELSFLAVDTEGYRWPEKSMDDMAERCFKIADAMLKARNK
jgi:hypothetical protein